MTRQEHATAILAYWQQQRQAGVPPEERNIPADIGNMTYGLVDNARDLCDIWMKQPERRSEFGDREFKDIAATVLGLSTILQGRLR